jgi:hypothetical protein
VNTISGIVRTILEFQAQRLSDAVYDRKTVMEAIKAKHPYATLPDILDALQEVGRINAHFELSQDSTGERGVPSGDR